ncbi:DUF2986 domain-containing protein [Marinomonas colpomeniae]|uniref:DUF2986 domain-containing protein n=1 Tax=Marinomonas colpomeniae TaxID=2774408 RepID=A0ABR8NYW2_9GAMM|nr:DUF2986 domain-containing protein [Marinomonas colpomeniae]MBD5770388.1 DUF2986 domain-containing protein [Marinomonas colpomeniae]
MNRRKKIKDIYGKRMKQANLKVNPKKAKPKYISKAERALLEANEAEVKTSEDTVPVEQETTEEPNKDV